MPIIQKIFAYNTGSTIAGTTQVGDIAISQDDVEYSANYGGLQWWGGPDETNGYVIAYPIPGCNRQTPIFGLQACLGFKRSTDLTSNSFIELANSFVGGPPAPFSSATDASTYLTNNGYWNSYFYVTPTPTPTIGATPTPTVTNTPTVTQTPTATDLSSITTYTISGCTSLNTFVANLGPGALAPGDVFYFDFTGGTLSGCYRIVNKINATPTDGTTPLYFYSNCALCVAAREVTPTPTVTSTSTPTPTPTTTPTVTPTNTNTPTNTSTSTQTPTPSITNTQTPTTSPVPVTGYGYNLVVLPYNAPTSGNTIFPTFATPGDMSGTTNPNTFTTNGVYWNAIDNASVDRTSYYSGMTGVSVTAYFTQNGNTAIYSGSTTAFTFDGPPGQQSFNYNPNIIPGQLVLIQSASTNFVTGQTVYISYVVN